MIMERGRRKANKSQITTGFSSAGDPLKNYGKHSNFRVIPPTGKTAGLLLHKNFCPSLVGSCH